jgi:hypothetical protein
MGMGKVEVMKITLFGEIVAGDYGTLDDFGKLLEGKLKSRIETELFRVFSSAVLDVAWVLSKLNKSMFETSKDFDAAVFKALVSIRSKLIKIDSEKNHGFLFWDILFTRENDYRLPIAVIHVTDGGRIYLFEAEFTITYNPDTKTSSVNLGLWYKRYISFTPPYITDYNVKREIARKLFKSPITGVVEVEVISD